MDTCSSVISIGCLYAVSVFVQHQRGSGISGVRDRFVIQRQQKPREVSVCSSASVMISGFMLALTSAGPTVPEKSSLLSELSSALYSPPLAGVNWFGKSSSNGLNCGKSNSTVSFGASELVQFLLLRVGDNLGPRTVLDLRTS